MAAQIAKDEQESFDSTLAFCEYIASFINFEAVKEIQNQRTREHEKDDAAFKKVLESLSGEKAPDFKSKEDLANGN